MNKRSPLVFDAGKVSAKIGKEKGPAANEQTHKRANTKTKNSREGRQFIAAHVVPEAAKQFKLLSVQQGRTTQDLLIEAINDLFTKHHLSRIA